MSRLFRCLGVLALLLDAAPRLGAATEAGAGEPVAFLQGSVSEVLEIVASHDVQVAPLSERLRPILQERFDLAGITRRAVGAPWRQFSPDQHLRGSLRAEEHACDHVWGRCRARAGTLGGADVGGV